MMILALDTSSVVASIALGDEKQLIAEYNINYNKSHSQKLLPMIDELLNSCDLRPKDIDVFAVSLGPGSFTGLRIGITTVKAMAQALDKPVVGVPTLEGLAYNLPFFNGLICPIIDAQRESVYSALYKWDEELLSLIREPEDVEIKKLIDTLKVLDNNVLFLGDGVERFKSIILEEMPNYSFFPNSSLILPRATSILEIARNKIIKGQIQNAHEVLPIYMRKSQAERQYEARLKGCEL